MWLLEGTRGFGLKEKSSRHKAYRSRAFHLVFAKFWQKGPLARTYCQKRPPPKKIVKKDHLHRGGTLASRHVARAATDRGGKHCSCEREQYFRIKSKTSRKFQKIWFFKKIYPLRTLDRLCCQKISAIFLVFGNTVHPWIVFYMNSFLKNKKQQQFSKNWTFLAAKTIECSKWVNFF